MIEKKKTYGYILTESNRQLASLFKGVTVDEENGILWSEQNLNYLGLRPLGSPTPPKFLFLTRLILFGIFVGLKLSEALSKRKIHLSKIKKLEADLFS